MIYNKHTDTSCMNIVIRTTHTGALIQNQVYCVVGYQFFILFSVNISHGFSEAGPYTAQVEGN